jgi:hypothetical protein
MAHDSPSWHTYAVISVIGKTNGNTSLICKTRLMSHVLFNGVILHRVYPVTPEC